MEICNNKEHEKLNSDFIKFNNTEEIEKICNIFKILGEPSRMKIILTLMNGEMCVFHITKATNLKQSLTSHQLKILKSGNVLKSRKEGKQILYSISDEHIKLIIKMSLQHIGCKNEEDI